MKELDCVEVIVEKEKYAKHGVHKGMQGWICLDECIEESWLVNFPQYGDKADIATIGIKEDDMKVIPKMDARVNEQIKAQFEDSDQNAKAMTDETSANKPEDISDYLI